MKQGHIKISRKMFDGQDSMWEDGTPYDARSAWIWLIQHAAFQPYVYRGRDQLQRGEFVASIRYLAERFKWSKSAVQRWLAAGTHAGQIAGQRMGHFGRVYLIVKYDTYQSNDRASGTPSGTPDDTKAGQIRSSKKAVREENTYPEDFERVWSAYPKRAGGNSKVGAFDKWQARIAAGVPVAALEDGVHRYAKFCEATNLIGTTFVKQAETFFGPKECWLDEWDVPLQLSRGQKREPNLTDPHAPGYAAVVDGVPNAEFLKLIGSTG